MASTLAFLLSLEPTQAIVRMVNDANGTNFRLDRFTASTPVVVGGTTTKVTLTSTAILPVIDDEVTVGSIDFTYERLDLAVFLKGVLDNYHPSLPCSTQTLLDEITHRIDQQFYGDDILLQELTRVNGVQYALTAKPQSLRFVGSITLPLIAVTDISTLYDANLIASVTATAPYVPNLDDAAAYITGTDILNTDATVSGSPQFGVGSTVLPSSLILQIIRQQVADPMTGLLHAPWYADSSAPGPYNLYNSPVIYRGSIPAPGTTLMYQDPTNTSGPKLTYAFSYLYNTAIPSLDSVVVVAINPAYCTNFVGTLSIPYSSQDFDYTPAQYAADRAAQPSPPASDLSLPGDGFVAKPRLLHNSVVSLSDGSAWNVYLNERWVVGDFFQLFQTTPPVTMDGTDAWVATYDSLTYTNLYNATVAYNGQVRQEDLPSASVGLDRVMVVDFTNSDNSLWTGQYPFYYQSPISISATSFTSTVDSQVHIALLAAGNGVTVIEVDANNNTLGSGVTNLPPGLKLDSDEQNMLIDGTPTDEGNYTYYLRVTSGSTSVFFTITHVVKAEVTALSLNGNLAPAVENAASWVSYLDIEGGLAPYTLSTITGDLPSSITAEIQYDTVHLYGTWEDNAMHHFNLEVTSTDSQTASRSFDFQASGDALNVIASASLNGSAVTRVDFEGSFQVIGGQAPYTYTVSNGSFPPGLLLNGGTGRVSGAPTATGTYSWTTTVASTDGYSGSVTCTLTITVATYADVIQQDNPLGYWPCNETSGTVLHDVSGNGLNGTIATTGVALGSAPLWSGSSGSLSTTALINQAASIPLGSAIATGATAWAVEAVGCVTGSPPSVAGVLVGLDEGNGNESSDPGIWGNYGATIRWHARVNYSDSSTSTFDSGISSLVAAHLLLERNGATSNFYVNGQLVASGSPGSFNTLGSVIYLLGSGAYNGSYGLIGSVSDVAVYGQALGPQKALARAQFLGFAQ